MNQIVYDESGTLLSGYFYHFGVQFDDNSLAYTEPDRDETWVVAKRTPTNEELARRRPGDQTWTWVRTGGPIWNEEKQDYLDVEVKRYDCPVGRDHVTHSMYGEYELEIEGGTRVGDIVPEFSDNVVLSASFAEKLRKSGLTGFDLVRPAIVPDDERGKEPDLLVLRFLGRNCLRPVKVVGVENACPFCGCKPLACSECGYWPIKCPQCDQIGYVAARLHKGAGDRRLKSNARSKDGPILSGRLWDGSDFIGSNPYYVTKRTVDWLLSVHAAPFYAQPVRVCVDGMSDEQKQWLERAMRPVGT